MTDRQTARDLLATMWLIRAFEERVSELVRDSLVTGLVHLSIGQEGTAAGVSSVLGHRDYVYSGHRAHGHFLARGADPGRLMAELMGRASGLCKGKGGSMHLADPERGLMGATGVVGGNIPLALGTALAAQEAGNGRVAVVFFGDGAAQSGSFHESLNLASLWQLPVLLVCENNGYAEFTPRSAHTRVEHVTTLAGPYNIPSRILDGNDVLAVRQGAAELLKDVRGGQGPALLECLTYRLRGHYEGDPTAYRQAAELAEWKERDPLARLTRMAKSKRWLTRAEVSEVEATARSRVEKAVEFAKASEPTNARDLMADVYA